MDHETLKRWLTKSANLTSYSTPGCFVSVRNQRFNSLVRRDIFTLNTRLLCSWAAA